MDASRRETLALGVGLAAGLLAGGLLGAGVRRRDDPTAPGGGDAPDRRIVATRDPETVAAACDAVEGEDRVVDLGDRRTLVAGPLPESAVEDLLTDHAVDYVEPDLPVRATDVRTRRRTSERPRGRSAARQRDTRWGVARIDAPTAHEAGFRGEGVRVAVIDSGVVPHPDIAANVGDGVAFVDCSRRCTHPWSDDAGHGTGCAGVIAAASDRLRGVAPGATVHPVKVLDAEKAGRVSRVAAGLRWAVDRGCSVVNVSISGPAIRAYGDAVRYAARRGTVVVASAGNVGPCEDCVNPLAAHPAAVAVGATDRRDEVARFSATGTGLDLAAPGVGIETTGLEAYVTVTGTSFAAPHVAGVAALCRGAGHAASAVRSLLGRTAEPLSLPPTAQGRGLVDAAAALVPTVRTREPRVDGRTVTFRGSVPRLDGDAATVRFAYRWRFGRRWRTTPAQRVEEAGGFRADVRLRRFLTYVVEARARFPDGTTVAGDRVRVRRR